VVQLVKAPRCATSRKVAGSIQDGVTEIFRLHNLFGHTVSLGTTQPLTDWWPVHRTINVTILASWKPLGLNQPQQGLLCIF
jgi:hypothetical protein